MSDPTQRFSSRVENYVKYRPGYPPEVVDFLVQTCGLTRETVIADIGSGTGILTHLLLEHGNPVFGVEPNQEMREAGERLLQSYPSFTSVAARAEATTLPAASVDLVTAGQAFHWFDKVGARQEFERILKPGGWVVLIWNDRHTDSSPFLVAYEELLREFATDYDKVNHQELDPEKDIGGFFGPGGCLQRSVPNSQTFDFAGLKGRLLSSSYAPEAGHPNYEPMLQALEGIFYIFEEAGLVRFEYDTKVYAGQLT
jgi:SAM-dependent methyltransferase